MRWLLELLFTQMTTEMQQNFDRLSIQLGEQTKEIKRIPSSTPPVARQWGLTAEQLHTLSKRMEFYAPKDEQPRLITCVLGDPESTKFAAALVSALRDAGWKLPGSGYSQALFTGPTEGLIVKIRSQDEAPVAAREFISVLRENGIEPVGWIDGNVAANEFEIIVGAKPDTLTK